MGNLHERVKLIHAKIAEAWGSSVGERGYGAPEEVAERLYDALYNPTAVVSGIQDRLPEGTAAPRLRESTERTLTAPLAVANAPDRAEFVASVSDTIVRGVPVAETLLPGAREQLAELSARGTQVLVWSAGEPKHQHHKLAAVGIVDPSTAPAIEPPVSVSTDFGAPIEVASAIAHDKTTPANMAKVERIAGDRQLIVADDRSKNVLKFLDRFPDAQGIWVQFGAHAEKAAAKLAQGGDPALRSAIDDGRVVIASDISQVVPTVDRLREAAPSEARRDAVVAFDFDDTIIDNDRRRDLQHHAVHSGLQQREWLERPAPPQNKSAAAETRLAQTVPNIAPSAALSAGLPPLANAANQNRAPSAPTVSAQATSPQLPGRDHQSATRTAVVEKADKFELEL